METRSARRAIAGLIMCLGMTVVPAGAAGAAPSSCGGQWQGRSLTKAAAGCELGFVGDHFNVYGSYSGSGVTSVEVVLQAETADGDRVTLGSCRAAIGFGMCTGDSWGIPGGVQLEPGQTLFCTVKGRGEGDFRCSSD